MKKGTFFLILFTNIILIAFFYSLPTHEKRLILRTKADIPIPTEQNGPAKKPKSTKKTLNIHIDYKTEARTIMTNLENCECDNFVPDLVGT